MKSWWDNIIVIMRSITYQKKFAEAYQSGVQIGYQSAKIYKKEKR